MLDEVYPSGTFHGSLLDLFLSLHHKYYNTPPIVRVMTHRYDSCLMTSGSSLFLMAISIFTCEYSYLEIQSVHYQLIRYHVMASLASLLHWDALDDLAKDFSAYSSQITK